MSSERFQNPYDTSDDRILTPNAIREMIPQLLNYKYKQIEISVKNIQELAERENINKNVINSDIYILLITELFVNNISDITHKTFNDTLQKMADTISTMYFSCIEYITNKEGLKSIQQKLVTSSIKKEKDTQNKIIKYIYDIIVLNINIEPLESLAKLESQIDNEKKQRFEQYKESLISSFNYIVNIKNKDGKIDKAELESMFGENNAVNFLKFMDPNKDTIITVEEFIETLQNEYYKYLDLNTESTFKEIWINQLKKTIKNHIIKSINNTLEQLNKQLQELQAKITEVIDKSQKDAATADNVKLINDTLEKLNKQLQELQRKITEVISKSQEADNVKLINETLEQLNVQLEELQKK